MTSTPHSDRPNATSFRKLAHLEVCLNECVESSASTGLEDFHLVHRPLAAIDYREIDTSLSLWNKKLTLPLICAAMTGGHPDVRDVNETIAKAAEKLGFAMGIGSQRAAIEKDVPYITESFGVVRELAPNAVLIGNLGAAQFSDHAGFGENELQKAIQMVKADAMAIHVNPAQELVQIEGDVCFSGFFRRVAHLAERVSVPVILKEVGSGFCREDAAMVQDSCLSGIDVGGTGGTSWVGVEALLAGKKEDRLRNEIGKTFWNWGIPTALSVLEARSAMNKTLIATGGVRNGLDAAKLIALGADLVGMALPFLKAAKQGPEEVEFLVQRFYHELRVAMCLAGCRTLPELRKIPVVVTGHSLSWIEQRGLKLPGTFSR